MIKVFSKIKLSESLKKEVEKSLEKYLGRKLDEIAYENDEKIMAGIKIEIDSEVIDLTLNHRLEKITEVLNNA